MKLFQRLFLLAVLLSGFLQSAINDSADISGSGNVTQISTSPNTVANWVTFFAPSGNSGTARFGDSTTTASRGGQLPPGSSFTTPLGTYPLSGTYVYVANGDSLTVFWGN